MRAAVAPKKRKETETVSKIDEALSALKQAEENIKDLKYAVQELVALEVCISFTKKLDATKIHRDAIEKMFTKIDYKECFIGSSKRNNDDYAFWITFSDTNLAYDDTNFIEIASDVEGEHDKDPMVLDYVRFLLKGFMTQFHLAFSKHIPDLVSLKEIMRLIDLKE